MADASPARTAFAGLAGEVSRQILLFGGAGIAAAIAHYGVLISLVRSGTLTPVPATLCGYVAGGIVSYALNRRHTYRSERRHHEAAWRFIAVAGIGFLLTWGAMHLLVDRQALPYLPAQLFTTCLVMVWSFCAHKWWTFRVDAPSPREAPDVDRTPR